MTVGERAHNAGSAPDLAVESLDGVVCAYPCPMLHGKARIGQGLRDPVLDGFGRSGKLHVLKLGNHLAGLPHRCLEALLGMYRPQHLRDVGPLVLGNLAEDITIEMNGAALVSRFREDLLARS